MIGDWYGKGAWRRMAMGAVALVLGGGSLVLVSLGVSLSTAPDLRAQQQPPSAPTVTTSAPVKRTVQDSAAFSGQFQPVDYVEARARVSGYLTEIHFTDGQIVKKGDLLFVIDPRPYEDALAIAKAQVDQAQATLELAKRQLARGADLVKKSDLAQSDYDTRVQQVAQAEAQVETAKAQVRDAELNLEFTRITAPVSGRVGAHQVSIGNLISGGGAAGQATLLTTIVSLDPIWFIFDMSESDYLALTRDHPGARQPDGHIKGIPADLQFAGESGWPHRGALDFLDNQIDRSAGTMRARAVFANPDLAITPGQFARVRLPAGLPHDALLVPDSSIVTDQSFRFVMTVAADGAVVPKRVTLGPIIDGLREVKDGLLPTDQVVIDGLLRARAGAKVTAQAGTITPAPTN